MLDPRSPVSPSGLKENTLPCATGAALYANATAARHGPPYTATGNCHQNSSLYRLRAPNCQMVHRCRHQSGRGRTHLCPELRCALKVVVRCRRGRGGPLCVAGYSAVSRNAARLCSRGRWAVQSLLDPWSGGATRPQPCETGTIDKL